ncbi:PPC domain-containing DNA-binding protein [Orenia marismortui]|uniref:PPC domain-containing protein n=1 Tax=Orenia marismortui TaxID=46469 RepID=A0A4R8H179_9FIRM|nr:PPC domain-containing DNA-binding protein [Orenia marismortui]TDX53322.1 hypothetical protein C7959_103175 [Orenia marismortui]
MLKKYRVSNLYQGRLERGDDLLEKITEIINNAGIKLGRITAIGAVEKAKLSFYNQNRKVYEEDEINKPLEIVSLLGNISLKDNEIMIHAHIALGDEDGRLYGGHLTTGTRVFACEFIIEEFEGEEVERKYDEKTGLPLWRCQ